MYPPDFGVDPLFWQTLQTYKEIHHSFYQHIRLKSKISKVIVNIFLTSSRIQDFSMLWEKTLWDFSTPAEFLPSLSESEANEGKMKAREDRIGWRRSSIAGANIVIVHIEIRSVGWTADLRYVRSFTLSNGSPVHASKPSVVLKIQVNNKNHVIKRQYN